MPRRRVIVHPSSAGYSQIEPVFAKMKPPDLHIKLQVFLSKDDGLRMKYWQTFTFGEYDPGKQYRGSVNGWCWHGSCRCGVNYNGDAVYVNKAMRAHVKIAGHKPGSKYEITGRAVWQKAKRSKVGK